MPRITQWLVNEDCRILSRVFPSLHAFPIKPIALLLSRNLIWTKRDLLQGQRCINYCSVRFALYILLASRFDSSSLYHIPSTRPQMSTEALMKNQTDWLKEFRQTVPLSSQLTLGASRAYSQTASSNLTSSQLRSSTAPRVCTSVINDASISSTMNGETLSHLPSSAGSNLLPTKPRLVLDSSNNIQLLRL